MQTGTGIGACDNRGPGGVMGNLRREGYTNDSAPNTPSAPKHTKRAKTPQARQNTPSAPKHPKRAKTHQARQNTPIARN